MARGTWSARRPAQSPAASRPGGGNRDNCAGIGWSQDEPWLSSRGPRDEQGDGGTCPSCSADSETSGAGSANGEIGTSCSPERCRTRRLVTSTGAPDMTIEAQLPAAPPLECARRCRGRGAPGARRGRSPPLLRAGGRRCPQRQAPERSCARQDRVSDGCERYEPDAVRERTRQPCPPLRLPDGSCRHHQGRSR